MLNLGDGRVSGGEGRGPVVRKPASERRGKLLLRLAVVDVDEIADDDGYDDGCDFEYLHGSLFG